MNLSFFCDRIDDLIIAAGKRGSACTGFLDTEHQKYASDYLNRNIGRLHGIRYLFYGGYSGAERRMLVLYDPSFCSYFYSCGRCVKVPDGADFSAVVSECCIYDDINFKNLNGNEKSRIDDLSSNISVSDGWDKFSVESDCPPAVCMGLRAVAVSGSGYAELDHRSYMGAVLALGLSRDTIGDIIVRNDREAIIITARAAAELLLSQPPVLNYVGRDKVCLKEIKLPSDFAPERNYSKVVISVASARIDAVVSEITGMSRGKVKRAVSRGEVILNCVQVENFDVRVSSGDVVSIRKYGKFKISDFAGKTKSGRLRLTVLKYI